jgi:hypothetical protein
MHCKIIAAFLGLALMVPHATLAQSVGGMIALPPVGKGQVVFFRIGQHTDEMWSSCAVREGEGAAAVKLVTLGKHRYFVHQTTPGIHQYSTKTGATDRLSLEIEAGETYFVECRLGSGVVLQHSDLRPANEADFVADKRKQKPVTKE